MIPQSTIQTVSQIIELERQEINYWKEHPRQNSKMIKLFIKQKEESLGNFEKFKNIVEQRILNNQHFERTEN